MNSKNIFIGNVMLCVGFKGIIGIDDCTCEPAKIEYEKDEILIKIGEDRYVDIRNYTSLLNINLYLDKLFSYNRTMGINPIVSGEYFVDELSLRSYYTGSKDISIRQLKREIKQNNKA